MVDEIDPLAFLLGVGDIYRDLRDHDRSGDHEIHVRPKRGDEFGQ